MSNWRDLVNRTTLRGFRYAVKVMATVACLALLPGVACQKPAEKPQIATETVAGAHQGVQGASGAGRAAWREDYRTFKRKNDAIIAENERRITALRKDVGKANPRFRSSYNVRIDELARRNTEIRDRTDNYRDDGDAKWLAFKHGNKRAMDSLKVMLKKTTVKNGR